MRRGFYKQLSVENKFGRRYYCCFYNHSGGLAKHKRTNRRTERRKLNKMLKNDIK